MVNLKSQGYDSGSSLDVSIPSGSIIVIGGSSYTADQLNNISSNGFAPCDGRALSRTIYANLFSVINTNYGSGDGSTTFNVPNLTSELNFIRMTANAGTPSPTATGSNTHTHTGSGITGDTTNGSFPHTHDVGVNYANNSEHGVGHGAAWFYVGSNTGYVVYKNDGSCAGAAINHGHDSIYREYAAGNGGAHAHTVYATVGSSTDTVHSHTYNSTESAASTTAIPEYISALFFIKL